MDAIAKSSNLTHLRFFNLSSNPSFTSRSFHWASAWLIHNGRVALDEALCFARCVESIKMQLTGELYT